MPRQLSRNPKCGTEWSVDLNLTRYRATPVANWCDRYDCESCLVRNYARKITHITRNHFRVVELWVPKTRPTRDRALKRGLGYVSHSFHWTSGYLLIADPALFPALEVQDTLATFQAATRTGLQHTFKRVSIGSHWKSQGIGDEHVFIPSDKPNHGAVEKVLSELGFVNGRFPDSDLDELEFRLRQRLEPKTGWA